MYKKHIKQFLNSNKHTSSRTESIQELADKVLGREVLDESLLNNLDNVKLAFPFEKVQAKIKYLNARSGRNSEKVRSALKPEFKQMYKYWTSYVDTIGKVAKKDRAYRDAFQWAMKAERAFKSLLRTMSMHDFVNLNARISEAHTALYRIRTEDKETDVLANDILGEGKGRWTKEKGIWVKRGPNAIVAIKEQQGPGIPIYVVYAQFGDVNADAKFKTSLLRMKGQRKKLADAKKRVNGWFDAANNNASLVLTKDWERVKKESWMKDIFGESDEVFGRESLGEANTFTSGSLKGQKKAPSKVIKALKPYLRRIKKGAKAQGAHLSDEEAASFVWGRMKLLKWKDQEVIDNPFHAVEVTLDTLAY